MGIFDTHAHYQDKAFDEDRTTLLSSLSTLGVDYVLNAATNLESSKQVIAISESFPFAFAAVGLHPSDLSHIRFNDAEDNTLEPLNEKEVLDTLSKLYSHRKVVAIGEIGLEYHYDFIPKDTQKKWLEYQLQLAKELDAPIIFHDRDAHEDTITLLKKYKPKGVVHCFSGSTEMLKEILKLDMYIGLGGAVTFHNAKKPIEAAKMVPLDKLLLETDAPYMAPVPYRGKRCDSSMITEIANVIASARGETTQTIINVTKENAFRAFPKAK
ncbi:MAG: TatD family hydrolase [Clostridia bacterium]|nr:TatD family hydrolase [Clostridia bacterium]